MAFRSAPSLWRTCKLPWSLMPVSRPHQLKDLESKSSPKTWPRSFGRLPTQTGCSGESELMPGFSISLCDCLGRGRVAGQKCLWVTEPLTANALLELCVSADLASCWRYLTDCRQLALTPLES